MVRTRRERSTTAAETESSEGAAAPTVAPTFTEDGRLIVKLSSFDKACLEAAEAAKQVLDEAVQNGGMHRLSQVLDKTPAFVEEMNRVQTDRYFVVPSKSSNTTLRNSLFNKVLREWATNLVPMQRDEIRSLTNAIEKFKNEEQTHIAENNSLRDETTMLREENARLRAELAEKNSLRDETTRLREENARLRAELDSQTAFIRLPNRQHSQPTTASSTTQLETTTVNNEEDVSEDNTNTDSDEDAGLTADELENLNRGWDGSPTHQQQHRSVRFGQTQVLEFQQLEAERNHDGESSTIHLSQNETEGFTRAFSSMENAYSNALGSMDNSYTTAWGAWQDAINTRSTTPRRGQGGGSRPGTPNPM